MNSKILGLSLMKFKKLNFSKFFILLCLLSSLKSSRNEWRNNFRTDSNYDKKSDYVLAYSLVENTYLENHEPSLILKSESQTQNLTSCTKKICDSIGGICIDDYICKCNEGFTTYLRNNNLKLCNYQKKNSVIAAFLELFLGFGLGHLYSGRKIFGIFKMFLSFLLCCIGCCAIGIGMKLDSEIRSEQPNTIVVLFYFIFICIFYFLIFWQILDFIMFIFKIYTDGNEISLF